MRLLLKQGNYWRWIVFTFKAYIIAAPIIILACQVLETTAFKPDASKVSYWDARTQAKAVGKEMGNLFRRLEWGYLGCLVVLTTDALLAARRRNRSQLRNAVVFIILGLVSMVVLCFQLFVTPR